MKGIVLAGGTATRLYPLTIVTNKHLLPIYDRPMIYYPIETLAGMGIEEVLVIVGGKSVGDVVELLADGAHFGLDLTYRYQRGALGIAHAIGLARNFVRDDTFCCVLGDNVLRGPKLDGVAREFETGAWGAGTLLHRVADPHRFGVAELNEAGEVVGFEEKPVLDYLVSMGVYVMNRRALDHVPVGQKYGFDNLMLDLLAAGKSIHVEPYSGFWLDIGRVDDYARAIDEFEARRAQLLK